MLYISGPLGWMPVTSTPQPADTDTTTHDYSIQFIDGTPTQVWTERPWTADELAANLASANTERMVTESVEAVDKLVLSVEALNAITAMTNATINSNPAAVIKTLVRETKTIARQLNREARLTSGRTETSFTGQSDI
jgi:methyl coenzyme M reductase subunit C-like uncharacterized protein (methanogenesis marker protein 7)